MQSKCPKCQLQKNIFCLITKAGFWVFNMQPDRDLCVLGPVFPSIKLAFIKYKERKKWSDIKANYYITTTLQLHYKILPKSEGHCSPGRNVYNFSQWFRHKPRQITTDLIGDERLRFHNKFSFQLQYFKLSLLSCPLWKINWAKSYFLKLI